MLASYMLCVRDRVCLLAQWNAWARGKDLSRCKDRHNRHDSLALVLSLTGASRSSAMTEYLALAAHTSTTSQPGRSIRPRALPGLAC